MDSPSATSHLPLAICHLPLAIGYPDGDSVSLRGLRHRFFGLHPSSLSIRPLALFVLLPLLCLPAQAQRQADRRPPLIEAAQGKAEARVLVAEMLAQKPDQNSTNTGQVRIRDRDDKETEIPARFTIMCTPTNWLSVYETLNTAGGSAGEKLVVIHADNQPNHYRLMVPGDSGATNGAPKELTGSQTMAPFAGSDFWLADLGLEFLHWPEQRVLWKEMRHSKSCCVLESTSPEPALGGYARVRSWVIIESPHGIVHADAFDMHNKLIKEFDPVNLEKVNGIYQLSEIEMRNHDTRSHTWIKFNLPKD
jgi:hypothetical protein